VFFALYLKKPDMRPTLILLFLSSALFAQVPNSGFENWTEVEEILEPDDWTTGNAADFIEVIQNEDAYEGEYSMLVRAIPTGLGSFGDATTEIAIDYIPPSLDFYVKTFVEFGLVQVSVDFYNDDFLFETFSWDTSETVSEWTFISLELIQFEPVLTHAVIRVESIVGDLVPGSAEIAVDQMDFGMPTSIESLPLEERIQVFPNPASDQVRITGSDRIERIRLTDLTGKTVLDERILPGGTLQLPALTEGVYLLNLHEEGGSQVVKKLFILK
jgi:hypothetical protein